MPQLSCTPRVPSASLALEPSTEDAESVKNREFAEEALPCLSAVRRFALRLSGGDETEAEDLVQDTFLRAYRRWETYTPGTRCLSWLFTICRNAAARRGEVRSRQREHLATDLGVDDVEALFHPDRDPLQSDDPEGDFFDGMLDDEVVRAIHRLPTEYRDAVILCDIRGLAYDEIAAQLGVAAGTIKSRIHRGRRNLREALRPYAVEIGYLPASDQAGIMEREPSAA